MQAAARCVLCRTTGGHFKANTRKPARVSLAFAGLGGAGCHSCYQLVRYRVRNGLDPVTGKRKGDATCGS